MNIAYHHIRNPLDKGHGGATVAMLLDDNRNVTRFAVSRCHPKDAYNKRLGRVKSAGRLNSPTKSELVSPPAALNDFLKNFGLPAQV